MPYPTQPYIAVAVATFPSGFKRDLVAHGSPCEHEYSVTRNLCGNVKTYLDGGSPRCREHLLLYCAHGAVAHSCFTPGQYQDWLAEGVQVRKLKNPRPVKPLGGA